MTSHTFPVDNLILGGSLESLMYAYMTETPIVIGHPRRPSEIDELNTTHDLTFLGYKSEEKIMTLHLWERLSFLLSLSGYLLIPNLIENIRQETDRLVIVTSNMRKVEVIFNNLIEFDSQLTNYALMYDWFAVRSGGKHDVNLLEDDEYLAHKLIFHPSKRIGVRNSKDVVAITKLRIDNIYNMEYSEAYVTMKTRQMMKEAGIRGTSKGFNKYRKRTFDPVKIEHLHREIKEQVTPKKPLDRILSLPPKPEGKLWTSTANLFRPRLLSI